MLLPEHFCNYFEEMLLFQKRGLGERCKLPQRVPERRPGNQSIFKFCIVSNRLKSVKSIIWLISLYMVIFY